MTTAVVEPIKVFGLDGKAADNVCFLDEQTVVYPAGCTLVIYNSANHEQRFISGTEGCRGFSAMAVSPNRRYVAVAEIRDTPSISVFDLHTLKRRKTLSHVESQCTEFVSLAFSPDSKYLVSVGGAPDWNLLYWSWEKSRGPMACIRAAISPDMEVYSVTFNPQDNTHLCVTGNGIFKMFRYQEGTLKSIATPKMESQNFLCQAWLSATQIVVGTDQNKLLLIDGNELKAEYSAMGDSKIDGFRIECVGALSKGFACAGAQGVLYIFEATDDSSLYARTREVSVPEDCNIVQSIRCLSISPSEERLVATTNQQQLYSLALVAIDPEVAEEEHVDGFVLVSQAFHHGPITSVSLALRKPLAVTSSEDSSIRVWNYAENKLELKKYFPEPPMSIAMHPSGLHVLAGFSDKLRLLNLLVDDIRTFKEFPIKNCRECTFSHGGHRFAVANGNNVEVYNTFTFELVVQFKGHNNKIRSIVWSLNDLKLTSCGNDGAVYEWDVEQGTRVGENVLKSCSYNCVACTPDASTIFAVGSDKSLKEISQNAIVKEQPTANKLHQKDVMLTQVAMSQSGRLLLAATETGSVRALRYPLTSPWEGTSFAMHWGPVNNLEISPDDQHLFSVGNDGCLMVYKLSDKEGRGINQKETAWADEILVTRSDLERKNKLLSEKEVQVRELKVFNEYQLQLQDMARKDQLKEMELKYEQEIETLRTRLQAVIQDKERDDARHDQEAALSADSHVQEIQGLDHTHNKKLLQEYEKYKDLQNRAQEMQEKCERQLAEMEITKARALEDLAEFWENKLLEKSSQLDAANESKKELEREYLETRRQIELDADQELLSIKNMYERQLKAEQENSMRLKGDNGILRKKFKSQKTEIDDQKKKQDEMEQEQKKLHQHIRALERDIISGKKEIEERDETIQDKEKRIYDLKKKNQELEKFKFVLDYKIKELKKQIEPRENEIKDMTLQISQMDDELAKYHELNTRLELDIENLHLKLKASDTEVKKANERLSIMDQRMLRFRSDLHSAAAFTTEPKKLVPAIRSLYKTYCEKGVEYTSSMEEDVQREATRQREFLEKSNTTLRGKLEGTRKLHEEDATRIMKENVVLIGEINVLRQELQLSQRETQKLSASLQTTRKLSEMKTGQPLPDLSASMNATGTLRQSLESGNLEKIITMQREQIRKLRSSMSTKEMTERDRPPSSGTRLEPLHT